jgi:ankyrin repeat protein
MNEEKRKTGIPLWAKVVGAVAAGLLALLVLMWVFLPELAIRGLYIYETEEISKQILIWQGPRVVRHLFDKDEHFNEIAWFPITEGIAKRAEEDASYRRAVLDALGDPNARGAWDMTMLHLAASNDCITLADALLEEGADPALSNLSGGTPLHLAAGSGATRSIAVLIEEGVDVNARDIKGRTPLHWAANSDQCEAAELLIAKGADPTLRDNRGQTALHNAVENGNENVADLLRKYEMERKGKGGPE